MKPTIRKASSEDFEAVVALFRQTEQLHESQRPDIFSIADLDDVTKVFQKFLSDESVSNLILEVEGVVSGYLRYRVGSFPNLSFLSKRGEKKCYIEEIVVDQSARGLGYGSILLRHLEQQMKEEAVPFIHLHVFDFNSNAKTFYSNLGFQPLTMELGKQI